MNKLNNNEKGAITVFLVILLIPSIIIVGAFIDFSRYHVATQIVNGAGELALDSVLANYNHSLKKYYGLFAVSNKEYYESTIQEYFNENLNVKRAKEVYNPLSITPYSYEIIDVQNANLANPLVLKKQIVEHVKYKAPYKLGEDFFSMIAKLKSLPAELGVYESELELNEKLASISLKYQALYGLMRVNDSFKLHYYNDYVSEIDIKFNNIASKIDIVNFLQDELLNIDYNKEDAFELQQSYENRISDHLQDIKNQATYLVNERDSLIDYYLNYQRYLDELVSICEQINSSSKNTKIYVEVLKNEIDQLSQNSDEKTKEDLQRFKQRIKNNLSTLIGKDFNVISQYINENFTILNEYISELQSIRFQTQYGSKQLTYSLEFLKNISTNAKTTIYSDSTFNKINEINLNYLRFSKSQNTEVKEIYDILHSMFKDAVDNNKGKVERKAKELLKKALSFNSKDKEPEGAKNIPSNILKSFSSSADISNYKVDSSDDLALSKGIFKSLAASFEDFSYNLRDNLYIQHYIKTMFTCASTKVGDLSDLNYSYSPQINYLFGSEQEYLLFGNQNAKTNILLSKSLIYGLRFALNYKYALTNTKLCNLIKDIALISSSFVPISIPLIETIILSSIVATETALDLQDLMNGEDVVVFKTDKSWKFNISSIKRFFEGKSTVIKSNKAKTNEFKMGYEDYLSLLLLTCHNENQLKRISNLIELNMSNVITQPKLPTDLQNLSFKTINAKTAVSLKAEAILNLVFLPIPFVADYVNSPELKGLKIKYNSYRGY